MENQIAQQRSNTSVDRTASSTADIDKKALSASLVNVQRVLGKEAGTGAVISNTETEITATTLL
jgi:hypothetical protein